MKIVVQPSNGDPALLIIKGFGVNPFTGQPLPMASRNLWENGRGPGSRDYWERGEGPGSREFWERGRGPGSRDYWERGEGVGSRQYWNRGNGPGSRRFYEEAREPGTRYYYAYGDGPGSRQYWERGNGPGSRYFWDYGRAVREAMKSAIASTKRTKFSSEEKTSTETKSLSSISKLGKSSDVSSFAKAAVARPAPSIKTETGLRASFGAATARMTKTVESFKSSLAQRMTTQTMAKPASKPVLGTQANTTTRTSNRQTDLRDFLRRRITATSQLNAK